MAFSAPPSQTTGDVIGATAWNRLGDNDKWLASDHPICIAYRSSTQTVLDATDTTVTWTNNLVDNSAIHSTSVNTSRFTAPVDGMYHAVAGVGWSADADGTRHLRWQVTGTGVGGLTGIATGPASPGGQPTYQQTTAEVFLAAGAYLELIAYQNAGNSLTILVSATAVFRWVRTT